MYLTEEVVNVFLTAIATNEKIVGQNPSAFWQSACYFENQKQGNSLKEMSKKFKEILQDKLGVVGSGKEDSNTHVYIDDFSFSGNRIVNDLTPWVETVADIPIQMHIILMGWCSSGQWSTQRRLKEIVKGNNKNIEFHFWSMPEARLENRLRYINASEVLWPTNDVCNDANIDEFINIIDPDRNKVKFRVKDDKESRVFSSEVNRSILEQEFTLAGLKIRSFSKEPAKSLKPLGYSPFPNLGFGSMITTYRNCPNNCPLALWWGSPSASPNSPIGKWYPLLERKTYDDAAAAFAMIDVKNLFG